MTLTLAYGRPIPTADTDPCTDCEIRDISVCQPLAPRELTRLRQAGIVVARNRSGLDIVDRAALLRMSDGG